MFFELFLLTVDQKAPLGNSDIFLSKNSSKNIIKNIIIINYYYYYYYL